MLCPVNKLSYFFVLDENNNRCRCTYERLEYDLRFSHKAYL